MTEEQLKITKNKVGLTVFAGIILLVALLIIVGTDEYFFMKTYDLKVYINDAAGLVKGAPVLLGGVKIGNVEKIDFQPERQTNNIMVTLKLLRSYQRQITTGTVAEIRGLGILGDKFIHLSIGRSNESSIPDDGIISFQSNLAVEDVMKSLSPAASDINVILGNLRVITDSIARGKGTLSNLINTRESTDKLEKVSLRLTSLIESIDSKDGSIGMLIHDKALYNDMSHTVAELKQVIGDVHSGKGSLGKLVVSDSLYNQLNDASAQLKTLLQKTQNDTTVVGGVLNDGKLLKNIKTLLTDLNDLIVDIRKNPDKYVKVSVF
jgi:phospholipid/cholesterol/gamma-HCH transport system substrate-binding protein